MIENLTSKMRLNSKRGHPTFEATKEHKHKPEVKGFVGLAMIGPENLCVCVMGVCKCHKREVRAKTVRKEK